MVGAGPAGLACATVAAECGHEVDLFEAAGEIGGQFNYAKRIPGKEEFHETIRYFRRRIEVTGVRLHLNRRVGAADLAGYDEVVIATGVVPRDPKIPGSEDPRVANYVEIITGAKVAGRRVAVVGAGGIGFDVAEFLVHEGHSPTLDLEAWRREWGVGDPSVSRGGVEGVKPQPAPPSREVVMLQRKVSKVGAGLGKTTGWIHRAALKMKRVEMLAGVNYEGVVPKGLAISFGEKRERGTVLEVDTIVICAGQESLRDLEAPLAAGGRKAHVIGGASFAGELDAKRAIEEGSRLAASL